MRQSEINWVSIARYISGECNEEKKRSVESRMQSDMEFHNTVNLLKEAWNCRTDSENMDADVDLAWLRYNLKFNRESNKAHPDGQTPANTSTAQDI